MRWREEEQVSDSLPFCGCAPNPTCGNPFVCLFFVRGRGVGEHTATGTSLIFDFFSSVFFGEILLDVKWMI